MIDQMKLVNQELDQIHHSTALIYDKYKPNLQPQPKNHFSAVSNSSHYSEAQVTKGGTSFLKKKESISEKKESSRLLAKEKQVFTLETAVQTMKEM